MASAVVRCAFDLPESDVSVGRVYSLLLEEGISSPSRAVVRFPDHELSIKTAPKDLIGKIAVITLKNDVVERKFQGVLSSLSLESGRDNRSVYVAEIIDRFYASAPYRAYRVFERRDLKSILTAVLDKSKVTLRFDATSPHYPICVQYGESDYAFVSRLLEENGLLSRIDGEVLQVTEDSTKPSGSSVACSHYEGLHEFQVRHEAIPLVRSGVSHVYQTESWPTQTAPAVDAKGAGPDASANFYSSKTDTEVLEAVDDDTLKRLTTVRAEEAAAATCTGFGRSVTPSIRPGVTVSVKDSPRSELNGDYFVWRVVHDFAMDDAGAADNAYGNSFWCLPKGVKFRPHRTHNAPRVFGLQVGKVVAPSSASDEDETGIGRVRVQLPWMGRDDGCQGMSFWARVLEGHAGADHGTVFIPEKDDEVLVAFEGGNVNSPVVLGGLYTGVRKPLLSIPPGHKNEQKLILTKSGNAVLFEDLEDGKARLSLFQKEQKNCIRMNIEDGKTSIEVTSEGSIQLKGTGSGEILLQQGGGTIRLDEEGNVEIAGPSVKITGTSGNMVLNAPKILIN